MKISKNELVKLLSEHLGSDETSVNSQLDKLIADINKATEKGETFTINGLGQFNRDDLGLSFEVSKGFATEINYNYEGRMPVDIDRAAAKDIEAAAEKAAHKPSTAKKDILIVDDEVEGEEDPFGVDEFESTATVPEEQDGSGKDSLIVDDDETVIDSDEIIAPSVEQVDDQEAAVKSESPSIIDDSVDEEELAIIEEVFSGKDTERDELQENDDLDDFFMEIAGSDGKPTDSEEDQTRVDNIEIEDIFDLDEPEDQVDSDIKDYELNDTVSSEEISSDSPISSGDTQLQELDEDAMTKAVRDGIQSVDKPIQPSVLDEYFDAEKESVTSANMPEQVFPDSDRDVVDSASGTGLDDTNEDGSLKHGPRIVSLEEAKADDKLSFGDVFKYVAIFFIVFILGGGVWWLFMGSGKMYLSKLPFTTSQTATTYQIDGQVQAGSDLVFNTQEEVEGEPGEVPIVEAQDEIGEVSASTDSPTQDVAANVGGGQPATTNDASSGTPTQTTPQQTEQQPVSSQSTAPVTQPVAEPSVSAQYGLRGSYVEISGPVYSIIVHSLPTQTAAQNECNVISSLDLRCFVREATGPQGRRTFRVAIGQFSNTIEAQNAIRDLQEPFRTQNFIARTN